MLSLLTRNKKLTLSALLLIVIAGIFWTQSRIPALSQKAMMGDRTVISGIAFDIVIPVSDSDGLPQRVLATSVNWAYTNWKGMLFGLLFAAAFLTLLRFLPLYRQHTNTFINTLKGMITGIPLSVCVNCATPIAQGMHKAGLKLEIILATLISSPTLNIVVLSILFTLLPLHLAIAKLLGTLLLVLLFIPLIVHLSQYFSRRLSQGQVTMDTEKLNEEINQPLLGGMGHNEADNTLTTAVTGWDSAIINSLNKNQGWAQTVVEIIWLYLKNLWYLIKMTLPFMLLAGFLGAVVIELFPLQQLNNLGISPGSLFLAAMLGTFLPVPIAFDIIIASVLLASGVKPAMVMTLLFTLGIYSIYPFSIIWKNISRLTALLIFLLVSMTGVALGLAVDVYEQHHKANIVSTYEQQFQNQQVQEQSQKQTPNVSTGTIIKQDTRSSINQSIIQTVEQYCQKLSQAQALECYQTFFDRQFKHSPQPGLCETIPTHITPANLATQLFTQCQTAEDYHNTVRQAIAQNQLKLCQQLNSQHMRKNCLKDVVYTQIKNGKNIQLCDQLPDSAAIKECQRKHFYEWATFRDPSFCQVLETPHLKAMCTQTVTTVRIAQAQDINNCEVLKSNPDNYHFCLKTAVMYKIGDSGNTHLCQTLVDKQDRFQCVINTIMKHSQSRLNPAICTQLPYPALKDICHKRVRMAQLYADIDRLTASRFDNWFKPNKQGNLSHSDQSIRSVIKPITTPTQTVYQENNILIEAMDYNPAHQLGNLAFSRLEGTEVGINHCCHFSALDDIAPFRYGGGIASGDINNDNYPDLIFATPNGIQLYINTGSLKFAKVPLKLPKDFSVTGTILVALVDINNDGWQDIFVSRYNQPNVFIINDQHNFSTPQIMQLPEQKKILTIAASFGDINQNGLLDLVTGNWSYGEAGAFIPRYSQNRIYLNQWPNFNPIPLDEVKGETLSVLLSDFNHDHHLDLIVGNDREVPDMFYLGQPATDNNSYFKRLKVQDKMIPVSSFNTMSFDSADFNNDLQLDIFSVDMSFSISENRHYCDDIHTPENKTHCQKTLAVRDIVQGKNIQACQSIQETQARNDCLLAILRNLAIDSKDPALCQKIPSEMVIQKALCQNLTEPEKQWSIYDIKREIPQQQHNTLLLQNNDQFIDISLKAGVSKSFWSWNAKAADLDNDQWQDLYIGNGIGFGDVWSEMHSNVFFHNNGDLTFSQQEQAFGLQDYLNTPAFTYTDLDRDGDIDIVANTVNGPARVFINNNKAGHHSISFSFKDAQANRFGIGNKVIIYYGDVEKEHHTSVGKYHQIRELKAGGGFLSFDNPVVHFGLGSHRHINSLEIHWSDGQRTTLAKHLDADHFYQIIRSRNN